MLERSTQVAIIGAGPAGLLLGRLLSRSGVATVVLEAHSRQHVEGRIRAGVLEQGSVDVLEAAGVAQRLRREGLVHDGAQISFAGMRRRIDFKALTGRSITVYGQHEVVKDLIAARLHDGDPLHFGASCRGIADLAGKRPLVRYCMDRTERTLACDFVAGCDGHHGVCRDAIPPAALTTYGKDYPFGWLGVLAATPPPSHELIYAGHERGFALASMRSTELSRLYVQCGRDDRPEDWPDERIWSELRVRLEEAGGISVKEGAILQRGVTRMRSFIASPLRFGRLYLAGDAGHIVPPTGAKGMNLAIADVRLLARALAGFYAGEGSGLLERYSEASLKRVWKAQRFSWWMTSLLHRFPDATPFDRQMQVAELDYVTGTQAGARVLAENYVGLPFEE